MPDTAGPGPVRVWLHAARVEALAASQHPGWLSDSERARLRLITAPGRRAQFLGGRWLARHLLAAAFGGHPLRDWSLSAPADGPPRLLRGLSHAGGLPHLSISHSGGHVACAVARVPVGLDLEVPARRRDTDRLAAAACTRGELDRLALLGGAARERHFYAIWTLKEAWLKRRGEGMSPGRLARLHTAPGEHGRPDGARVWQAGGATLALIADGPFSVHRTQDAGSPFACTPGHWRVTQR